MSQFLRFGWIIAGIALGIFPTISLSQSEFVDPPPAVAQLSDVTNKDWAFQALRSIASRYGCRIEHSEQTYRGEQSLTRNEFATGLSTCLEQINLQITEPTHSAIPAGDLAILNRLQTDFATELSTLQNRVTQLEPRTADLEARSFSPTTQLRGEVIFAGAGVAGGNRKVDGSNEPLDRNLVFSSRVRLDLRTSFNGQDRLRVRLQARSVPELEDATGTPMANLGFDGDSNQQLELDRLDYETQIGDRAAAVVSLEGGGLGDYISTVNSRFSGSDDGAVSLFARENPIRRQGSVPGIGLTYDLSDRLRVEVGYVASKANQPDVGIAQSSYAAVAQVTIEPTDFARFSLTYIRSFNGLDTGTGSTLAGDPFNDNSDAIVANSYGAEAAINLSRKMTLGGRVGWIQAIAQDLVGNPQANLFTWAALLSVKDLGGDGNLLGFVV
nr:iron uptake porin [Leptolyngbya sp. Prado105]